MLRTGCSVGGDQTSALKRKPTSNREAGENMQMQIPEAMYSPHECSLILGKHPKHAYKLIREKKIEAVEGIDGMMKVPKDELLRYIRKQRRIAEAKNS